MEDYLPKMGTKNKNFENILESLGLSKNEKDEIKKYKLPSFTMTEMNEN